MFKLFKRDHICTEDQPISMLMGHIGDRWIIQNGIFYILHSISNLMENNPCYKGDIRKFFHSSTLIGSQMTGPTIQ